MTQQSSIQMDDGWRNMIKDLSKAWGLPVNSTTKVLRTCTIIVWAVMGTTSTVQRYKTGAPIGYQNPLTKSRT